MNTQQLRKHIDSALILKVGDRERVEFLLKSRSKDLELMTSGVCRDDVKYLSRECDRKAKEIIAIVDNA